MMGRFHGGLATLRALCACAGIGLVLLLARDGAAQQITAFWQRVPIHAAAVANDPALAGMQTWDLMVSATGSWQTGHLRAQLPSGQYYNHPLGGNTRPNSAFFPIAPAIEFDTYITSPGDFGAASAPSILVGFPQGEPLSMGGSVLSVSWGDLNRFPNGTHQVARLTFPLGVLPDVLNNDPTPVPAFSYVTQAFPDAAGEIPDLPEPAAAGAAGAVLLLRGRRHEPAQCGAP